MAPVVTDNPDQHRFEIHVDDRLAGFAQYRLREGEIAFTHTEVDDAYEGQGLGSTLARAVLESAAERDLAVIPYCPFIAGYLQRHPDLAEQVPEARRAEFGL